MVQTFTPASGDDSAQTLREKTNDALLALQSEFRGTAQPSGIVAGQSWSSSTDDLRRFHDGSADHVIETHFVPALQVAASGSVAGFVYVPWDCKVVSLVVVSNTTTTGSDGSNNWAFQATNVTDTLALFSAAPTTNGSELTADTPRVMTPDQNTDLTAGEVVEVELTVTGAPTSLGRVLAGLVVQRKWT